MFELGEPVVSKTSGALMYPLLFSSTEAPDKRDIAQRDTAKKRRDLIERKSEFIAVKDTMNRRILQLLWELIDVPPQDRSREIKSPRPGNAAWIDVITTIERGSALTDKQLRIVSDLIARRDAPRTYGGHHKTGNV